MIADNPQPRRLLTRQLLPGRGGLLLCTVMEEAQSGNLGGATTAADTLAACCRTLGVSVAASLPVSVCMM